jgi:hypothetical protein
MSFLVPLGHIPLLKQYSHDVCAILLVRISFMVRLDDWLLTPLRKAEAHDLLKIAESRYKTGSTIFISQFDPGGWHSRI